MLLSNEIEDLLEHLDSCDECSCLYSNLKQVKSELTNLNIECPEDLSRIILDKIQKNKDVQIVQYSPPKRNFFYVFLASCACLALIFTHINIGVPKLDTINDPTMSQNSNFNTSIPEYPQQKDIPSDDIVVSAMSISEFESFEYDEPVYADIYSNSTFKRSDLLLDDYAFVYEFIGNSSIDDINGKILHIDEDNTVYLEVENIMPSIESIINTLEKRNYNLLEVDHNDFRISSDAQSGIFIIHQN